MARKKKTIVEPIDTDEPEAPLEPAETYAHGSMWKGDTPPEWLARAIEAQLAGNPYRDMPTPDLEALYLELSKAVEQRGLVERVLQARHCVW